MEKRHLTHLVAIDLSAAFDTVNRDLLLEVMENCFGVCAKAKYWIHSYLSDRSFQVSINGKSSASAGINLAALMELYSLYATQAHWDGLQVTSIL